jgi:hypothetical protein
LEASASKVASSASVVNPALFGDSAALGVWLSRTNAFGICALWRASGQGNSVKSEYNESLVDILAVIG